MSTVGNILEVGSNDFQQNVVEKSHQIPVLVDFWADWCGPCKMQLPVLTKLAGDYGDSFRVAKVNTDTERELATQHGIRSLPTLRLYRHGAVVEELMGAQTESALRPLIEAHMDRASDQTLQQALELAAAGRPDEALKLLASGHASDPQNHHLTLEYARLCLREGQLACARDLLSGLPRDEQDKPETRALKALFEFSEVTASAPDRASLEKTLAVEPENPEARYQLAIQQVLAQDYDAALDNLLTLLKRHRNYGDNAAQHALLAVFDLLGDDDRRVPLYRRQMFNLLH